MKKWLLALFAGVLAGIGMNRLTKKKQERAMEQGLHIPYGPYETFFKRPLDVILSVIALIVLSPVLLVTAILVKLKLGSPIIFIQERPGMIDHKMGKERIFKLYNVRVMKADTSAKPYFSMVSAT